MSKKRMAVCIREYAGCVPPTICPYFLRNELDGRRGCMQGMTTRWERKYNGALVAAKWCPALTDNFRKPKVIEIKE